MNLPLWTTVLDSMEPNEEDSTTMSQVNSAMTENLKNRCSFPVILFYIQLMILEKKSTQRERKQSTEE